jgi:hypothetical protein
MNKIAERWQITPVKKEMINDNHSVELSHSQSKVTWFVTFEGDFYTEFTFNDRSNAEKMYDISLGSSVYMDVVAKKEGDN